MITGKNLFLEYENKNENKIVLHNVSFEIQKGYITSFIGMSGAGKTTLLKCIANLNNDYTGKILLDGNNIKGFSKKEKIQNIGMVAQHYNLFFNMSVLKNCVHPMMNVLGFSEQKATSKALKILEEFDIASLKDQGPTNISGGQQQRVAIARALCLDSQYILFDEPTSALDPQSSKFLEKLFKDLCAVGKTIILCSHDMSFVNNVSNKIYFMEKGEIVDCLDKKQENIVNSGKIKDFLVM